MNAIELSEKLHIEWRDDSLNYDTALAAALMLREQQEAIVKLRVALESVERRSRWSDSYINNVAEQALKDTEDLK